MEAQSPIPDGQENDLLPRYYSEEDLEEVRQILLACNYDEETIKIWLDQHRNPRDTQAETKDSDKYLN